jgi:large subunit ribosomal protein L7/L12
MSKLQTIISDVKSLTVIELAELVAKLQEEFGVSAASMSAPVAGGASAGQAAATEAKNSFKVELVESGAEKTKVIKALRQIKKDLGLIEAKNAAENLPYVVLVDANKEDTDAAKKLLEEAGAKVKIS